MTPRDVESIERATVAAVLPETQEELDGWLLPFDRGTVNRAKSAVPLQHSRVDEAVLGRIEARYQARSMRTIFRIAVDPCFDSVRRELTRRGYTAQRPVQVQVAAAKDMRAVSTQAPAEMAHSPDAAWTALFLGEGFDPVDGASRVKTLSRAPGSLYASVRENGRTVAAGAAAFSHGWSSVHGMRTDQALRGRGLAGRVLAGLADAAMDRGFERIFLQVEAGNAPAQALYRRAGFDTAWCYEYWRCN